MREKKFFLLLVLVLSSFLMSACSSSTVSISIKPNNYNFGAVETSATVIYTLKNNTSEMITVSNISFIGTDADKFLVINGFAPFDLVPKVEMNFEIEFTPKTYGAKEADLIIDTTYIKKPVITKKLKGFGYVAAFDPANHDFGTIDYGQSDTKDFSFRNDLERDITVTSFDITGTNIADFTIVSGTPGYLPANGGSILVSVEFAPLTHGAKTAELTATTTDGTFTTVKAELLGAGNVTLKETFDATTMSDTAVTTAEWGTTTTGQLTPTGLSSFGTGADGVYNPTSNANLDADAGPYNYTSITIPQGVVITVTGSQPLEILCSGDVIINGELNLDGKQGTNGGPGGAGGPGGGAGGAGGAPGASGTPGSGNGGGQSASSRSGGGGGYAVKGQDGFNSSGVTSNRGASGGMAYGNPDINPLDGGSGGGGGAGYSGTGGGGGGGGGAVGILAGGNIEIGGLISANGGRAGGVVMPASSSNRCYGGGGGSGGAVRLQSAADILFTGGSITVVGGLGKDGQYNGTTSRYRGGYGASGRIRLEDSDGDVEGIGGAIFPAPSAAFVSTPFAGGTGADGVFNPTSNITIDTSNGAFNYTAVNISAGITVTATGTNPLEIYCTGDIIIDGTINISGGNASANTGGTGVAGGFDGGNGSSTSYNGEDGKGPGGGKGGLTSFIGASGGGYGEQGQSGSHSNHLPGGGPYGTPELTTLQGGSGGGAGPGFSSYGRGSGGGAGGGALRLQAAGKVDITGEIISDGGNGTLASGSFVCPGAGGSGGAILVQGNKLLITGRLSARGGFGSIANYSGGSSTVYDDQAPNGVSAWGGHGRIRLEAVQGHVGGNVFITKGRESASGGADGNTALVGTCSVAALGISAGLIAQSEFFNSTLAAPTWQTAVINGTDLTQVKVVYQGADDDGNGNPDLATLSAWVDDLATLPAKQYVRFKVYFRPGAGSPAVEDIEMPFN